jgi:hypothetical protein
MRNVTPQQAADNWANGMSSSSTKMIAGIKAVTENPAAKAIDAIPRMVQGIQQAAADGRIARGLGRVTLQSWQNDMLTKGVTRVGAGASSAKPKVAAFFTQFLPYLQAGVSQLPARGDYSANKARAIAMMDYNHNFTYQK